MSIDSIFPIDASCFKRLPRRRRSATRRVKLRSSTQVYRGKLCQNGHAAPGSTAESLRYLKSRACIVCQAETYKQWRQKEADYATT